MGGESRVVVPIVDPVTDGLIDAINEVLALGQWEQVARLSLSLWEHAVAMGNRELAELVADIHSIALDAIAYPSGDDGIIQGGGEGGGGG
jgi:hypothetical protein